VTQKEKSDSPNNPAEMLDLYLTVPPPKEIIHGVPIRPLVFTIVGDGLDGNEFTKRGYTLEVSIQVWNLWASIRTKANESLYRSINL